MTETIVPTFQPKKKSPWPSVLIYALSLIGIGLLVYFGGDIISNLENLRGKSALGVNVLNGTANVFVNDEMLGTTPFESEDIKAGENRISLRNDVTSYDVSIDFLPNAEVAMNRDLGISEVFSSGQNFWLEKADSDVVLSAISEPSGANVFVDNTEVGVTPYSTANIGEGEYDLRVEKAGYETQTARIKIQNDLKLNVVIKLFPVPVPATINILEGSADLYDVYSNDALVTSDSANWSKAVVYWNETRGISIEDAGKNKESVFDYFVDYTGQVYDGVGKVVTDGLEFGDLPKGAYLRRVSDGPGLTDEAKAALDNLSISTGKQATILATGKGWLNIRSEPSLNGDILTKVDVGDTFTVLDEVPSWVKIKISDEASGWAYSAYVSVTE